MARHARPDRRGKRRRPGGRRHAEGGGLQVSGELLCGRQPVQECLRAHRRSVKRLYLAEGIRESDDLSRMIRQAEKTGASVRRVDPGLLDERVAGGNHQGVALDVSAYPYTQFSPVELKPESDKSSELVLLLDHVQDPQNLGSILRSADGAGVRSVILPTDRACGVTPASVRASAGAAEHMSVARVTNLVRTMKALQKAGYWIAGVEGTDEARLYTSIDLTGPTALVVGSEGRGLGRLVGETADFLVRLPMLGKVNSLNVGVATAIALYEVRRQQGVGA